MASQNSSWKHPPANSYRCNVDGAVGKDQSAVGWVIRDLVGTFCMALALRLKQRLSPLATEFSAIKEAINWSLNSSFENLVVVTDSKAACLLANSTSTYLGLELFIVKASPR